MGRTGTVLQKYTIEILLLKIPKKNPKRTTNKNTGNKTYAPTVNITENFSAFCCLKSVNSITWFDERIQRLYPMSGPPRLRRMKGNALPAQYELNGPVESGRNS